MSKQLVRRIAEIRVQMAAAKAEGKWDVCLDLNKSLGIMIRNER
jgi:hypothetical protein